jgi:hypothetical protein
MLLMVLRDIVNGDISGYEKSLLDESLKAALGPLRDKVKKCTTVFVSLHDLSGSDAGALTSLILERLRARGLLRQSSLVLADVRPEVGADHLVPLFSALNSTLQATGQRALLLIDEVEVLLDPNLRHQLILRISYLEFLCTQHSQIKSCLS